MRRGLVAFLIAGWMTLPAQAVENISGNTVRFSSQPNRAAGNDDGHGPYSFILDTGTHGAAIDSGLARDLELPLRLHGINEGVGAGRSCEHTRHSFNCG